MGCASAKQLSSVPGDEEDRDKAHSNGDAFSPDEYKMKGMEKVKCMHGEEERMNTRNQEHLEKSTFLHKSKHKDPSSNANKISMHSSESQQEFFRMLDEKIEKGCQIPRENPLPGLYINPKEAIPGRDYCSEEEDVT